MEWQDDKTYAPVKISQIEENQADKTRTIFPIGLLADFDQNCVAILEENGLDVNGFTWEDLIIKWLETSNDELMHHIAHFDSISSIFVVNADSTENQHLIAQTIQTLAKDNTLLKEIIALVIADYDAGNF